MQRRRFLKGLAAGAAGAAASGLATGGRDAWANWGLIAPGATPGGDFDGSLLVNKPRAYEIMDREGLDGLVALTPVNVFYLGNYISYQLQKLITYPSFAVMPRAENKPSILVVASSDLWNIANADREHPEIIPYGFPTNWQAYVDNPDIWSQEPEAAGGGIWPFGEDTLVAREQGWLDIEDQFKGEKAPTPEWGLIRALKEAGLEKGTVAVDDMRIDLVLKQLGHDGITCVEGENVFRKIRLVKSAVELKHMRTAAQANQAACMATLKQLDRGATRADIERLFMVEAAKRGAKATWIAAGTVGGLPDAELVEGRPLLIDSVCQINYYHGDFGRTYVLGEPTRVIDKRTRLLKIGWEAAFEALKPGMRYSEIRKIASDAMAKARGGPATTRQVVGPHSVGLQHTDQPYRDGLPFVVGDDLVLEENMTLTVDFPNMEPGWGATHLEDLVVVTRDGAEPLATMDGPLVVGG